MRTAESHPPAPRASSPGRAVPRQLQWHGRTAARLTFEVIRALSMTLRFRSSMPPATLELIRSRPVIFSIWHNRLALALPAYQHVIRRKDPRRRMAAMVSASRDGAMVARVLELFGAEPARGSSSRRGPQALRELVSHAENGLDLAITPDGPRGPCHVVQEGVIALAQLTQLPIIPASCVLSHKWELRSWDRFQVPVPFARCDIRTGEPLYVPREADEASREAMRQTLEERMTELG